MDPEKRRALNKAIRAESKRMMKQLIQMTPTYNMSPTATRLMSLETDLRPRNTKVQWSDCVWQPT